LTQFIATFPESSSPIGPHPVPLGTDSSRFAARAGLLFVNSHGTKIDLPGEFNLFRRSDLKSREKADYSEQICVPATSDLGRLRKAAANCRACDLYREATQTVFGEGGPSVDIVFIGEQPGDQEDKVGRPFVGPAGHILDEALRAVGIDRSKCYVTSSRILRLRRNIPLLFLREEFNQFVWYFVAIKWAAGNAFQAGLDTSVLASSREIPQQTSRTLKQPNFPYA
jgi:Uracil DNA glycosylase superfamily